MNPYVSIRADGDSMIGLGHVTRCISLAHMLRHEFNIRFFCHAITEQLAQEITTNGWDLVRIECENQLLQSITPADTVVLDGYHFDANYQKEIKSRQAKLVCIDDICSGEYYADLIINHAPGVKEERYRAKPYTQFALGQDYALLRPAFLKQASATRRIGSFETLLICFGGSDYRNLTGNVLQIVLEFGAFQEIYIVTGSANSHVEVLLPIVEANRERVKHFHAVDEMQMMRLMLRAEIAVVPASGILFEALACGNLVLSGYYVENQQAIFNGFKDLHAIVSLQDFNEGSVRKGLDDILQGNFVCNRNIIDGRSGERMLDRFKSLAA